MHVVIGDTVPPPSQSVRMDKGTLSTSTSVKDGSRSRLSLLTRYDAVLEGMSTGFQSVCVLGTWIEIALRVSRREVWGHGSVGVWSAG